MGLSKYITLGTAFAVAVHANPAALPQSPNFAQISSAPTVANGPQDNGFGSQTATLITTFASPSPSAAAAPTARGLEKRTFSGKDSSQCTCPFYDPWCFWNQPVCSSQPQSNKSTTTSTQATTSATTGTTSASTGTTSASTGTTTSLPSCPTSSPYTPYYPALATGYTTDPALAASRTATATGACPTTPEKGTYCGFINPLDPCAPQPDGYGPVPNPDTPEAFESDPALQAKALTAPTSVPASGGAVYNQVFKNLKAATQAQSYLGLRTLQEYDVNKCAAFCDCTDLCTSFNMFIERDPSLNPTNNDSTYNPGYQTVWGQNCPNPPSMSSYKCTLWGSKIDANSATNTGQTQEQFEIVITASDGYTKTDSAPAPQVPIPNPPKQPKNCGNKGIDAPKYCIGNNFFPGPFNPTSCYLYALALNSANQKAGISQSCKFFNAYYLLKNNQPHGTWCNLYNSEIDVSFATYTGSKSGGDQYTCGQSWGYYL
ncbi:hypothetical protein DOTSEDRAFT_24689 [Dothistroma septosporum NZE10]|uniref:Apple domain-containing protein n=1 Tax=Dothistroma septosporum (strain NZE10 / CBS 128990) TaxID=675120 RepID=N1PP43_DOTSN|nr:hypothetical protein DOTSEDRAFT_24689 [Dothistroma septosporum NZE10]